MTDPHDMTPEDQAAYVRAQLEAWLAERLGRPLDQVERELQACGAMEQVDQQVRARAAELAAARGCEISVEAVPSDDTTVLRYELVLPWELALELGVCPRCWSLPCGCPPIVLTLHLTAADDASPEED